MSKQAKKPVMIPRGVTIQPGDGNIFVIRGDKGCVEVSLHKGVTLQIEEEKVFVQSGPSLKEFAFLGLNRSFIVNAFEGVSRGFEKRLELVGVGFKANIKNNILDLNVGFSHVTQVRIPEDLQVTVEKNVIVVRGLDKRQVGQFSAMVRSIREPEPYKGKGIRYLGEIIRRKAGKSAKK